MSSSSYRYYIRVRKLSASQISDDYFSEENIGERKKVNETPSLVCRYKIGKRGAMV